MAPTQNQSQKNVLAIFGLIFGLIVVTGVGYYAGYAFAWQEYKQKPLIGAQPLKMKLVFVKKDIAAGQDIDYESVDERHEVLSNIALDAYSFTSEATGHKTKWPLRKGEYISHHDVLPEEKEQK